MVPSIDFLNFHDSHTLKSSTFSPNFPRSREMGSSSNPRASGRTRVADSLPVSTAVSPADPKKKWANLLPLFVAFVVVAEIAFLGRLDMAKNIAIVDSWAELIYKSKPVEFVKPREDLGFVLPEPEPEMDAGGGFGSESEGCEEWLEREDAVSYSRDFSKDPILVSDTEKDWDHCSVGCKFGSTAGKKPDAGFGKPQEEGTVSVLRSMESAQYYGENDLAQARRSGYNIVMTTSLSSDVPVGYFSWAEYDIMAPVQPKTEKSLAAAFISNCGARNFRLQALEALEKANIKIDSYGGCHRNRDGRVDKVETLKRYKFSLAFENSDEEDYVTEKFFQSLVAGTIPVVVGAPNIIEFAPSPDSILHIKAISDAVPIAKTMLYLDGNSTAFNQSLRWKYEGPSDSFKALLDMAAVHSSCRLCIHLATKIQEKDEKRLKKRPCKCTRGSDTVYHLYVRERGRFEMQSVFLRSRNITLEALESAVLSKFKSRNHVPIWKTERPEILRGTDELKVYRIYPVGLTQRQALYNFQFKGDADLTRYIENNPCAKLEVIFV